MQATRHTFLTRPTFSLLSGFHPQNDLSQALRQVGQLPEEQIDAQVNLLAQATFPALISAIRELSESDLPLLRKSIARLEGSIPQIYSIYEQALPTQSILKQNGAVFHIMACLNEKDKGAFACTNSVHNRKIALARDNPITWEVNARKKPLFEIMMERRRQNLPGGGSLGDLIALLEMNYRTQKIQHLDLRGTWEVTDEDLQRLLAICTDDCEVFIRVKDKSQEDIDNLFNLFSETCRSLSIEIMSCNMETINCPVFIEKLKIINCPQLTSITGEFSQTNLIDICRCNKLKTLPTLAASTVMITGCCSLTSIEGIAAEKAIISSCALLETVGKLSAQNLTLIKCPKLTAIEIPEQTAELHIEECAITELGSLPSVRKLTIEKCHLLSTIGQYSREAIIKIKNCSLLYYNSSDTEAPKVVSLIGDPNNPQDITIEGDGILEEIQGISHARKVTIRGCNMLDKISSLSDIEELTIENCFSLESIENLSRIEKLTISNCRGLSRIETIETAQEVTISNCDNLSGLQKLTSIDSLTISNCNAIRQIGMMKAIKEALISSCENLQKILSLPFSCKVDLDNCPSLQTIGYFPKWLWVGFHWIYQLFMGR